MSICCRRVAQIDSSAVNYGRAYARATLRADADALCRLIISLLKEAYQLANYDHRLIP